MQDLTKINPAEMPYQAAKQLREECRTELAKTRNEESIRARLMGTAPPEETARYLLLQDTIRKLDRRMIEIDKTRPKKKSWREEHREREAKYPEHKLEFVRTIKLENGPVWNRQTKYKYDENDDIVTKDLFRCSVCQEFFDDTEEPWRRCRGQFTPGHQRELPLIKVGMVLEMGDDHWEITEFLSNRIAIIPHKLSSFFESYLDVGQEYWLKQCCEFDDFELWDIDCSQMKRSTSQVIFSIIDGYPGTDLDS